MLATYAGDLPAIRIDDGQTRSRTAPRLLPSTESHIHFTVPKLCDFGLSLDLGKLAGGPGDQSDVTVGTIEYMSPEQAVGTKDLDVRADLYSLGVTLFHMVSGRLPFDAENREDILEKQVKEPLTFDGVESLFSDPLKGLIHRLMAKDREERPPNAKSFLQEIKAISGSKS